MLSVHFLCMCYIASVVSEFLRAHAVDWSLPGSSVHGILQERILEWVANTGVGCHTLLQGVFLTNELNPCLLCLLCWQVGSLPLVPLGKSVHFLLPLKFCPTSWPTDSFVPCILREEDLTVKKKMSTPLYPIEKQQLINSTRGEKRAWKCNLIISILKLRWFNHLKSQIISNLCICW